MRKIIGTTMILLLFGVPLGVMFAIEGFWLGLSVVAIVGGLILWMVTATWLLAGD